MTMNLLVDLHAVVGLAGSHAVVTTLSKRQDGGNRGTTTTSGFGRLVLLVRMLRSRPACEGCFWGEGYTV